MAGARTHAWLPERDQRGLSAKAIQSFWQFIVECFGQRSQGGGAPGALASSLVVEIRW